MKVYIDDKNNNLSISIIGSINTDTVSTLRSEVDNIDLKSFDSISLDFKEVDYISSAGLRQLLVIQKGFPSGKIKIINVNENVYDVFALTGFNDLFDIEKLSSIDDYSKYSFKEFLAKKVLLHKDEIIISASNGNISWQQLDKMSDLIAEDLLLQGVKKGSHVGICGSNTINWIATFFAIQKLGAMAILVSPLLGANEIQFLSNAGDISHLCYGLCVGLKENPEVFLKEICNPEKSQIRNLYNIINPIDIENKEVSTLARSAIDAIEVKADDPGVMIFTSGSTGVPKGVLLSPYNMLSAAQCGAKTLDLASDDIMCLVLPLFHIFGLVASMLVSMIENIKIVLPDKIKAEAIMDVIHKQKATILLSVPTLVLMMASSPEFDPEKVSSLRYIALGGAPVPEAQMLLLTDKFKNSIFYIVYGLSEMSPVSFTLKNDTLEHVTKSIGVPTYLVEVMIQDVVSLNECPLNEVGEILVKGESLMSGYYKTPIEKQDFDEKGWFHTGDLGYLSEDGYLHFAGRKKEIIIRGGENILPGEIASAITKLDYIAGCQVVGIPDETWGENVGCALVLKQGHEFNEEEFKESLKSELSSNKIPSVIKIYDTFPLLANGKVDVLKIKKDMSNE